AANNRC
ncbi:hypothetical protein D039_0976B, partial [Vibrio parahaemolyticus EKP-028]